MEYIVYILTISISICTAQQGSETANKVMFYEYGAHIEGEQVSFAFNGLIPAFTPIYTLEVTPKRHDVENRFTYLRAEYISPMSKVSISFDPKTILVTFHVQFPFIDIPIGVIGFSMPTKSKNGKIIS